MMTKFATPAFSYSMIMSCCLVAAESAVREWELSSCLFSEDSLLLKEMSNEDDRHPFACVELQVMKLHDWELIVAGLQ